MRNIRIVLEYEGTNYLGWQRQPQGMTVQQAVEEALEQITGKMPVVIGASRTDAGVHARGQVANFKTESALSVERLRGALNAILPRDIAVLDADEVPDDFNSRFCAISKTYHYTVWNTRVRPAIERNFAWHVRWPIQMELLQEASAALIGTHDFAAFQSANAQSETTVRTVMRAEWRREEPRLVFVIEADGFLYNMVRALAGTLIEVGRGRISVGRFREILQSGNRALAGRTAPAQGLCLMSVRYPARYEPAPAQDSTCDRCVADAT